MLTALAACGPLEVGEVSSPITNALRIYMSPTGSDANDGMCAAQSVQCTGPVKTLERVQEIIKLRGLSQDVEVKIAYGVYRGQVVVWDTYSPDHTITFMPSDYNYGMGLEDIQGRPIFTGDTGAARTSWSPRTACPLGSSSTIWRTSERNSMARW